MAAGWSTNYTRPDDAGSARPWASVPRARGGCRARARRGPRRARPARAIRRPAPRPFRARGDAGRGRPGRAARQPVPRPLPHQRRLEIRLSALQTGRQPGRARAVLRQLRSCRGGHRPARRQNDVLEPARGPRRVDDSFPAHGDRAPPEATRGAASSRRMTLRFDRAPAVWLAATVVVFACGSSIVSFALHVGRPARWAFLAVLVLLAVARAAALGARPRRDAVLVAAAALVIVALLSTLWSVDPRLTFERGSTVAALVLVAAALAATHGTPRDARRLAIALVAGMAVVAAAGIVTLLLSRADALQPATFEYGERYRGFGQNPDTVPLLLALGVPLALFLALEGRSRRATGIALGAVLFFAGSIVASDSRGAMLGALAGSLVAVGFRRDPWRKRVLLAGVVVAVFAAGVAVSRIPKARPAPSAAIARAVAPTRRTLFTSSGRTAAWRGAIRQAEDRPLLGYGFGTEEKVFVNRYRGFTSQLPENSYIGAALQLGLVGLGLLVAVAGAAALRFVSALRRLDADRRAVAASFGGAAAAALVMGVTQSYLFS